MASATNRLTLIAAIVPGHAVTLHTVFCLKSALSLEEQHVLCGLLNSFVANYLVRMRVGTHVTAAIMSTLRVPRVVRGTSAFNHLLEYALTLAQSPTPAEEHPAFVGLQAAAAHIYRLTEQDFAHVLGTFPLIAPATRDRSLAQFNATRNA